MADMDVTPESETPGAGVPPEFAEEVAALAAEAQGLARSASKAWKMTAAFFLIILAVIATYLGVLYNMLRTRLEPATVVQLAFQGVDNILAKRDVPGITTGRLPYWAIQKLRAEAPDLLATHLKPRLEQFVEQLPEWRKKWTEELQTRAPELFDEGVTRLTEEYLPKGQERLIEMVKDKANAALDDLMAQMEEVVAVVLEDHQADWSDLTSTDWSAVSEVMEKEFEREMGPVLDELVARVRNAVEGARSGLEELLASYQAGTLTEGQKLRIQIVRLTMALFQRGEMGTFALDDPLIKQVTLDLPLIGGARTRAERLRSGPPSPDEVDWSGLGKFAGEAAKRAYEEKLKLLQQKQQEKKEDQQE